MSRVLTALLLSVTALLLWLALGRLILVEDVGRLPVLAPERIIATLLLLIAPAATFLPLARWMRAPLYDLEAVLGWALFGGVLAFVRPDNPPTLLQFLLLLVTLTVALATLLTPLAYLVGLRVLLDDPRRADVVRARRQGYLAAVVLVSLGVLWGAGTLTVPVALLVLGLGTLAEVLVHLRATSGPRPARRATSGRGS